MPLTRSARPFPMLLAMLLGAGAFAVGLVTAVTRGPVLPVHAQDTCVQPSSSGCSIELSFVGQSVISQPTQVDNWLLNVNVPNEIVVSLGGLGADYQLWVYGPDNSLLGISNNPGTADEVLRVPNVGPGAYWIVVDSPAGQVSDLPYAVIGVAAAAPEAAAPAAVPFGTYEGPPPARTFLPY